MKATLKLLEILSKLREAFTWGYKNYGRRKDGSSQFMGGFREEYERYGYIIHAIPTYRFEDLNFFSSCPQCDKEFIDKHAIPILKNYGLDTDLLERDMKKAIAESKHACVVTTEWFLNWIATHLE